MLAPWHEFYGLIGTAAAALVALLFVAASILANVFTAETADGTRTFMSPVVFHYANILFLSLIALVPEQTPATFSLVIAVAALGSLAYSIFVAVRVFRHSISDLPDRLAYGCAPVAAYAAGLVAVWLMFHGYEDGLKGMTGAAVLRS